MGVGNIKCETFNKYPDLNQAAMQEAAQPDKKQPPPLPSARCKKREAQSDTCSMATASVDWDVPMSLLWAEPDEYIANCDPNVCGVASQALDTMVKEKSAFRKRPLLGYSRRQRIFHLTLLSLIFLLGFFLLNASLVSIAFWKLSKVSPTSLLIQKIRVENLDHGTANLALDIKFPNSWYMDMVNVILHSPTTVRIFVPDAVIEEEHRWLPMATITLPRFEIGRGGHTIAADRIPLELNSNIPLNDLIQFMSSDNQTPRKFIARAEMDIETFSYWIPIRFTHTFEKLIFLPQDGIQSEGALMLPKLEGLEFTNQLEEFRIKSYLCYDHNVVPSFLEIHLPDMHLEVSRIDVNAVRSLPVPPFAKVHIRNHTLSRASDDPAIVEIILNRENEVALTNLIEKIRDLDFQWTVSVTGCSQQANSQSLVQQWLRNFRIAIPMNDIINYRQLRRRHVGEEISATPAISINLEGVENEGDKIPKFIFGTYIDHTFISRYIGLPLGTILRGTLPTLQVHLTAHYRKKKSKVSQHLVILGVSHHPIIDDDSSLKFSVKVAVPNSGSIVRIFHELTSKSRQNSETDDLMALSVDFCAEGLLATVLRVFDLKMNLDDTILSISFASQKVSQDPLLEVDLLDFLKSSPDPGENETPVLHKLSLRLNSDAERVEVAGSVQFQAEPVHRGEFIRLSWESINVSVAPSDSGFRSVPLMNLAMERGSFQLSLAAMDPQRLIHQGYLAFTLGITSKSMSSQKMVIRGWQKFLSKWWVEPNFVAVTFSGRIGDRRISFDSLIPPRPRSSGPANWSRLISDVIRTRVRISGFREGNMHLLLELPPLGACSNSSSSSYKTKIATELHLPLVKSSICLYHRKGKKKCPLIVGLHHTVVGLDIVDGSFCDIRTRLASNNSGPELSKDDNRTLGTQKSEELVNFLPLSLHIADFTGTIALANQISRGKRKVVKASLGVPKNEKLSLLDYIVNGIGERFPLKIPLWGKKTRPRVHMPIKRLYKKKPVHVDFKVESKKRDELGGRLIIQFPKECLRLSGISRPPIKSPRSNDLALLMQIQWEKTEITINYKDSWFKFKFSPGHLALRLDERRIHVDKGRNLPTTRRVMVKFKGKLHSPNYSSATLRRILAHLHNYVEGRARDHTSKRVMQALPKKNVQLTFKTSTTDRKLVVIKSRFKVGTLVKLWRILWLRMSSGTPAPSRNNYAAIAKPVGFPGLREAKLPCFVPSLCPTMSKSLPIPPVAEIFVVKLFIYRMIQPFANMFGHLGGRMLNKFDFRRHPEAMNLVVRVPKLQFAIAFNDMDLIEVSMLPIEIRTLAPYTYPRRKVRSRFKAARTAKRDSQLLVLHVRLPKRMAEFGSILTPYQFSGTFTPSIQEVPSYLRKGHKNPVPLHYAPLALQATTERLPQTTLLSSLLCMLFREMATGYIPSMLAGGTTKMQIISSTEDGMDLIVEGIRIPNPIPFLTIVFDEHPVIFRYLYRDKYEFIRVNMGKLLLLPGSNDLRLKVSMSRTAFGKIPNTNLFSADFSDFLAGIAMGQELPITAIVDLSPTFRLRMDLVFPKGPMSLRTFDSENSYMDPTDIHDMLKILVDSPGGAVSVARSLWNSLKGRFFGPPSREHLQKKVRLIRRGPSSQENSISDGFQFDRQVLPGKDASEESFEILEVGGLGGGREPTNKVEQPPVTNPNLPAPISNQGVVGKVSNLLVKAWEKLVRKDPARAAGKQPDFKIERLPKAKLLRPSKAIPVSRQLPAKSSNRPLTPGSDSLSFYSSASRDSGGFADFSLEASRVKSGVPVKTDRRKAKLLRELGVAVPLLPSKEGQRDVVGRKQAKKLTAQNKEIQRLLRVARRIERKMSRRERRNIEKVEGSLRSYSSDASQHSSEQSIVRSSSPESRKQLYKRSSQNPEALQDLVKMGISRLTSAFSSLNQIYYHVVLKNSHPFQFKMLGMVINIEFEDNEGMIYDRKLRYLQNVLGAPSVVKPDAKMILSHPDCTPLAGDLKAWLACVNNLVGSAPIDMKPYGRMDPSKSFRTPVQLQNMAGIPSIVDRKFFRDGLCVALAPSLVSVAISAPKGMGRPGDKPFILNLIVVFDQRIPQGRTSYSDPCHHSLACIPHSVRAKVHPGFQEVTNTPVGDYPVHVQGGLWQPGRFNVYASLLINFKFKFHYGKRKAGAIRPGWALVFATERPKGRQTLTDYGYCGLPNSVALVLDPDHRTLGIHKSGEKDPVQVKNTASYPAVLDDEQWYDVFLQYRPLEQYMSVAIAPANNLRKSHASVFPVDVNSILRAKRMYIGLTAHNGDYAAISFQNWKVSPVVADLKKTRVFYVEDEAPLPHQKSMFLIQLRDSCDRVLAKAIDGQVLVRLKKVWSGPRHKHHRFNHTTSSSDSISAHPIPRPLRIKPVSRPELGLYEVHFRPSLPGRYRIFVAIRHDSPSPTIWHQVRNYHIYVRNLW